MYLWKVFKRLVFILYIGTWIIWLPIDVLIWLVTGKSHHTFDLMDDWKNK